MAKRSEDLKLKDPVEFKKYSEEQCPNSHPTANVTCTQDAKSSKGNLKFTLSWIRKKK